MFKSLNLITNDDLQLIVKILFDLEISKRFKGYNERAIARIQAGFQSL